jgi:hypothetical protein
MAAIVGEHDEKSALVQPPRLDDGSQPGFGVHDGYVDHTV